MTDSNTPAPRPDPRQSRLLRGLYEIAREQVERGVRTLGTRVPHDTTDRQSTAESEGPTDKP